MARPAVGSTEISSADVQSDFQNTTLSIKNRLSPKAKNDDLEPIMWAWICLDHLLALFDLLLIVSPSHAAVTFIPPLTATALSSTISSRNNTLLQQRAISTELSTCGYLDGESDKSRTANSGYDCRVDTRNGLWGFCPTTVVAATDCGLAGSCIDDYDCSDECGLTESTDLTTFTCKSDSYCSLALLTFGVDQTYSYLACGASATTDHYYITPTVSATTTAETSEPTTTSTETADSTQRSTAKSTSERTSTETSQASATPQASNNDSSSGSSTDTGAIVGGVIGGLVVIGATAVAIVYLLRRNRKRGNQAGLPGEDGFKGTRRFWSFRQAKQQPTELEGWTPQEMPAETVHGRQHVAELES